MIFLYILTVIGAFLFMEFMAWFTHKYIMHGFGWYLHEDHHTPHNHTLEKNDWYALIFAIPSIVFIYLGFHGGNNFILFTGIGIFLYGLAYFLFHDVYVHRRLKFFRRSSNNVYLNATFKAHMDHHSPDYKTNFGFLIAPFNYYVEEWKTKKSKQNAKS